MKLTIVSTIVCLLALCAFGQVKQQGSITEWHAILAKDVIRSLPIPSAELIDFDMLQVFVKCDRPDVVAFRVTMSYEDWNIVPNDGTYILPTSTVPAGGVSSNSSVSIMKTFSQTRVVEKSTGYSTLVVFKLPAPDVKVKVEVKALAEVETAVFE